MQGVSGFQEQSKRMMMVQCGPLVFKLGSNSMKYQSRPIRLLQLQPTQPTAAWSLPFIILPGSKDNDVAGSVCLQNSLSAASRAQNEYQIKDSSRLAAKRAALRGSCRTSGR